MAHVPYQELRGITLPGNRGIVTGRVHNWLTELSDDIAPVSCWVLSLAEPDPYTCATLCDFFVLLAKKLQENAGINVCLDGLNGILMDIAYANLKPKIKFSTVPYDQVLSPQGDRSIEVIKVADSLKLSSEKSKAKFPEHISIFESWRQAWFAVIDGKEVIFDYSAVREADQVSTGRDSFIQIALKILSVFENPTIENFLQVLSEINGTIKRGGLLKLGAVTTSIRWDDPLVDAYLDIPFANLPHVKKAITLSKRKIKYPVGFVQKLVQKYNDGEIFIEKHLGLSQGRELRSNVCRGITLLPKDQCLISHVNLGKIENVHQLVPAYQEVTSFLLQTWELQKELGFQMVDKQIAVGVVGLANMLRNFRVTYEKFIDAMTLVLNSKRSESTGFSTRGNDVEAEVCILLVEQLFKAMVAATELCKEKGMRAVHTVEPSESCARRYKDYQGYDLVPNINPPNVIPGIGVEHRHSQIGIKDEQGQDMTNVFKYGVDIQTASELSFEYRFALWDNWQKMMNKAGLAHMGCYENWGEFTLTRFYQWLNSDIMTLYYQQKITNSEHLNKGANVANARAKYKQQVESKKPDYCQSCSD